MDTRKNSFDIFYNKLLDKLRISVDEDKVDYIRISRKEYENFKKAMDDARNKSRLVVTRRNLLEWAFVGQDFNSIHQFSEIAKRNGFKHTPVFGTFLAAGLEQYVNRIRGVIKDNFGKDFYYTGQTIKFSNPVYIKDRVNVGYNPNKVSSLEGGLLLTIIGTGRSNKEVFSCPSTKLSTIKNKQNGGFLIPYSDIGNIVYNAKHFIDDEVNEWYYRNLGFKDIPENVAIMNPASFIIASILQYSTKRTGKPEGIYSKMNLSFYDKPTLGEFYTIVTVKGKPRVKGEFVKYDFEALCVQDNKPIVGGRVVCWSPK